MSLLQLGSPGPVDRDWYRKESEMVSHSFTCGNIATGDVPNTALLVRFDWVRFCFDVCWLGKRDGMICISPAQILLIVQTTAIRHSVFYFSSFSMLFNLEFQNLLLSVPSVLSCVLFCSLSFPFYSFLLFFLLPILFSPSVYSLYFLIPLIVFFSNLLSFLFSFLITLLCLFLTYALLLFNLFSFY